MKVFLLGLDGMTPKIIESYVEKTFLPNFKKVIDRGVSGTLRSTIPPITAPAWISLATGKNPGKHHVFEFRKRKGYNATLITKNTSTSAEPIWDILSRNGKKVKVINVPLTYPPDKVNGIMVSGMMTPNIKAEFTFPKEIKSEIFKLIPDYRIDVKTKEFMASGNKDTLLKEIFKITEDGRKLMNYFLSKDPCDLFFVTFVGPDRIQHYMWDEVQSMDPECVRYYSLLDDILGDILQWMDSDSVLFVVSDHGFGKTSKAFGTNKFLEKHGLLHLRKCKNSDRKPKRAIFESIVLFLFRLIIRMKLLRLKKYLFPTFVGSLKNFLLSIASRKSEIDWEKTKVFSLLMHNINVNLKGREPLGCVEKHDYEKLCEKVKQELLSAKDSETGGYIVKSVFKGDELYPTEQQADDKPDLVFILNDGYTIANELLSEGILTDTKMKGSRITGHHDLNGLLLAYGNVIKNTRIDGDIYDVMPTILYLLGLAIPEDVDGRVLNEAIKPEFTDKNKVRFEKPRSIGLSEPQMLREEAEELERHLKSLGYLS